MTYKRIVARNHLQGGYDEKGEVNAGLIRGDLRRLERDQQDEWHVQRYAELAGVSTGQARIILEQFFNGDT